jgi:hypothetical protein
MEVPPTIFTSKRRKTMTGFLILSRFLALCRQFQKVHQVDLHTAWLHPGQVPKYAAETPVVLRSLELLGPLDWIHFPERNLLRHWCQPAVPYAAFAGAMLIKLNEGLDSMGDLRLYLTEHPGLIPLFGFRVIRSRGHPCGFDPQASLPTQRHLTRMLREMPNAVFQFLLANSARLICDELRRKQIIAGECISLDTKHILAWVKENNPKTYVENRFDKTQQPKGDPDCKLGCKRKHNRCISTGEHPATPTTNPIPAEIVQVGDYYWGYGSGVVVVKVPDYGEFVLAEMTQPFNQPDISYFFPLMTKTEQILGVKPRFGTFDAAFDAWYVYDYFHRHNDPHAFAAVPFSEKGGYKAKGRFFSPEGLPLCKAGLPMPLLFTFTDRTTCLVEHERGKYVCPLFYPKPTDQPCPFKHKNAAKKGCTAMMPTSPGARLRYTLERDSEAYKAIYRQRTAVERINSQALALGIERPHIRNGDAITNINTLIYTLINLRMLQRLRKQLAQTK